MKKTILISREGGESRTCLLVSGNLVNIDAEGPSGSSIIGNIYKGRISDMHRGLNAAFVDIGEGREGFLSIQDIHPAILDGYDRRPSITDIFKKSQEILVQVLRDPVGEKGAMLTTCISLPGRYVVLMPAVEKIGISKKLSDDERKRLREVLSEVEVPEGFGVIVRTAGADQKKTALLRDLGQLVKVWNQIEKVYHASKAPSMVVQEQTLSVRFLREYLTTDVSEIIVDEQDTYNEVSRFLTLVMPRSKKLLRLYQDQLPLFVRYGVEPQIQKMFLRDVPRPGGGSIVIDRTEALTAIDVNSGRHKEKNIEETALKANLEAAEEVATQIMLRDLGGLLVIDFIDMYQQKNRTRVQQRVRECLKDDKAKFSVGRISQFGLLEMSRQRLRSGVISRATEKCTSCNGLGYRRTTPSSGLHILRRIRELVVAGNANLIRISAPVEVANFMQNSLRNLINDIEVERDIKVVIEGNPNIFAEIIEQIHEEAAEKKSGPRPVDAPVYTSKRDDQESDEQVSKPAQERTSKPAQEKDPKAAPEKDPKATQKRSRKPTRAKPRKQTEKTSKAKEAPSDKKSSPPTTAPESPPAAEDKSGDEKPSSSRTRRSRGRRSRGRRPDREAVVNQTEEAVDNATEEAVDKAPEVPTEQERLPQPERTARLYSPPEPPPFQPPSHTYETGQDSLIDKVIKKLLKLDR